jgi:hypothetical protein
VRLNRNEVVNQVAPARCWVRFSMVSGLFLSCFDAQIGVQARGAIARESQGLNNKVVVFSECNVLAPRASPPTSHTRQPRRPPRHDPRPRNLQLKSRVPSISIHVNGSVAVMRRVVVVAVLVRRMVFVPLYDDPRICVSENILDQRRGVPSVLKSRNLDKAHPRLRRLAGSQRADAAASSTGSAAQCLVRAWYSH